ncbi:hypothetical protein BH10PAT3_BH10PAT3_6160 [soil metagenome]
MRENSLKALLDFLSPTKLELLLYFIAGLFVILAAGIVRLYDSITGTTAAKDMISRFWVNLVEKVNGYNSFSNVLIWFLAGAVLYLIIWISAVILIDWYNDVLISTSFIHPKSFHQSDYWVAIVGRMLIRVASGLVLLGLIVIAIGYFVPYGYSSCLQALTGGKVLSMASSFGQVIFMTFTVLYASMLLIRLLFLRRRVYA